MSIPPVDIAVKKQLVIEIIELQRKCLSKKKFKAFEKKLFKLVIEETPE